MNTTSTKNEIDEVQEATEPKNICFKNLHPHPAKKV